MLGEPAVKCAPQGFHVERLGEIVVHARGDAALAVAAHRVSRQRDDRDIVIPDSGPWVTNPSGGGIAIDLGHLTVHQHQVVILLCEPVETFPSVFHRISGVAELGQYGEGYAAVNGVVLREEYPP